MSRRRGVAVRDGATRLTSDDVFLRSETGRVSVFLSGQCPWRDPYLPPSHLMSPSLRLSDTTLSSRPTMMDNGREMGEWERETGTGWDRDWVGPFLPPGPEVPEVSWGSRVGSEGGLPEAETG